MKYFILHVHHEPKSFNGALTNAAVEALEADGHEVKVSDLYAMNFDPVSDRRNFTSVADPSYLKQQVEEKHASENGTFTPEIATEIEKLEWCDIFVIQFPLWWFGLPGIAKGWIDKVFAMGRVYGGGKWYENGVFKGKRAMLSVTAGGPESMYGSDGLNGDINMILYPINHGMLWFTGFTVVPPYISWAATRVSDEQRKQYITDYVERLRNIMSTEPIHYPQTTEFDENFRRRVQSSGRISTHSED